MNSHDEQLHFFFLKYQPQPKQLTNKRPTCNQNSFRFRFGFVVLDWALLEDSLETTAFSSDSLETTGFSSSGFSKGSLEAFVAELEKLLLPLPKLNNT